MHSCLSDAVLSLSKGLVSIEFDTEDPNYVLFEFPLLLSVLQLKSEHDEQVGLSRATLEFSFRLSFWSDQSLNTCILAFFQTCQTHFQIPSITFQKFSALAQF